MVKKDIDYVSARGVSDSIDSTWTNIETSRKFWVPTCPCFKVQITFHGRCIVFWWKAFQTSTVHLPPLTLKHSENQHQDKCCHSVIETIKQHIKRFDDTQSTTKTRDIQHLLELLQQHQEHLSGHTSSDKTPNSSTYIARKISFVAPYKDMGIILLACSVEVMVDRWFRDCWVRGEWMRVAFCSDTDFAW